MNKAKITTLEETDEAQVQEDIAMTKLERFELAFELAEFALELNSHQEFIEEDPSISWIELHKISAQA